MISIEFLKEKFLYYNTELFGGILNMPVFKLTRAKTNFGTCITKRNVWENHATITISMYYQREPQDICNTLVHEMIHYYLYVTKQRENNPHGVRFHNEMNRINALAKYGLNITTHLTAAEYNPTKNTLYGFYCYKRKNGDAVLFKHAKTSRIWFSGYLKILQSRGTIVEFFHFSDYNKKQYNVLPNCREHIRGIKISNEEYENYKKL